MMGSTSVYQSRQEVSEIGGVNGNKKTFWLCSFGVLRNNQPAEPFFINYRDEHLEKISQPGPCNVLRGYWMNDSKDVILVQLRYVYPAKIAMGTMSGRSGWLGAENVMNMAMCPRSLARIKAVLG